MDAETTKQKSGAVAGLKEIAETRAPGNDPLGGERKRILTGDRPTGKLHIGHYVGSLRARVALQHRYETYILIADVQALTTHFEDPSELPQNVMNVALDYLAVGLEPEAASFVVQSMVPEIAELTALYGLLVTVNKLRHNPTTKTEAAQYGFDDLPYGFLGYPVSQAADISFVQAHLVPVGEDQVPHIELTRDILKKINGMYDAGLVLPKAMVGEVPILRAIDGGPKMSKSLGNCIYLADEPKRIQEVVRTGVTDPARIHKDDPGHPEVCNVRAYHQVFTSEEDHPGGLAEIEAQCRAGTRGCVPCKKILAGSLDTLLAPMRERRAAWAARPHEVKELLVEGTRRARRLGRQTLQQVKEAMKLDHFDAALRKRCEEI